MNQKHWTCAAVVAVLYAGVMACRIDARPLGEAGEVEEPASADAGTVADASTVPDASVPPADECVLHSDCPGGLACLSGRCVNPHAVVDAGPPVPPPPPPGCTPSNEICDGLDNDCDGAVDEGCPVAPPPPPPPCVPALEICDGLDNDCDGFTDEAPPGPHGDQSCTVAVPQAGVTIPGLLACIIGTNGHVRTECLPYCGTSEACGNDLDDNCDGRTNEHCPGRCESDAQCVVGQVCVGNEPFNGTCATPTVESCNGVDDDLDGTIDEGDLCPSGQTCVSGMCTAPPPPPTVETCNGLDDDADGQTDEGTCPSGQFCLRLPMVCAYGGDCVTPYACQADADRDTVADQWDNCPAVANVDQRDGDGDTVGDACDNCPAAANRDQADADGDRLGDACEPVTPLPPLPPPGSVTLTVTCPVSDAACALFAWWGSGRSATSVTGRLDVTVDVERCHWGVDVNARQGGVAGAWYADLNRIGDLNPLLVNGVPVDGRRVCDEYGCNLHLTRAQVGCGGS